MWQLALLSVAAAAALAPLGPTVDGIVYGPRRTLTCTWFTNFENSRVEQCRIDEKSIFLDGKDASVYCVRRTCAQMDAEARRLLHWKKREPPWGTFVVRIQGRVSLSTHAPRFLGDGAYSVMIEKVFGIRRAPVAPPAPPDVAGRGDVPRRRPALGRADYSPIKPCAVRCHQGVSQRL